MSTPTADDIRPVGQLAKRLRENVEQVIVGKGEAIDLIMVALLCEGHVLIEDVPGIGKTMLAKSVAKTLGCIFRRIQFTPDLLPSDLTGISFFNQKNQEFEFRPGPIFAQVVLADEINRATPRTQSALLECMEERQVTVEGESRSLPGPFIVLATQNPVELEGTFPLPEAQLDRFMLKVTLGYPSEAEEKFIARRFRQANPFSQLTSTVQATEITATQELCRSVYIGEAVEDYIVRVVRATRDHPSVELGASPRSTLALYHASQARAAMHGRGYVLPDDVKQLAPAVLTHRLMVGVQTRLRGQTLDAVMADVLSTVPVPVETDGTASVLT